ncbi:MAG: YfhO family protein [Flavobacteriaceae bacterium]|jgi:hypothetical protein|nr:YfhO family protein [Flavobacteriaceae bacterium]
MLKNKNLIFIIGSLIFFIVVAYFYANPVLSGKQLFQHDIVQYKGGAKELLDYRANFDEETYWSDSMFSGMPTYQMGAQFRGDFIKKIDSFFMPFPKPVNYLVLLFSGFFLLGWVAVRDWKYALLGATFFGLSTYFYIIIAAGHNGKVHTIAYFAPLLAGILLVYIRKKYVLGFIITTLFMGLQIAANHPQMTYYLFLALGFLFLSELIRSILKKNSWKHFFISTGIVALAFALGVGMNSQRIMANSEYVKETVRGKQILNESQEPRAKSQEPKNGMDKESILNWSYGKLETLNLFIPRLMGGASQEKGGDEIADGVSTLIQENVSSQEELNTIYKGFSGYTYWGEQPITSGPAYQGAVVIFLAILGFFFSPKKYRYWILGAAILTIGLAWGKNFMPLSDFFIDYVPFYNKFRAPSSILVVVELLFPLIAIVGLKASLPNPLSEGERASDVPKESQKEFENSQNLEKQKISANIGAQSAPLSFGNPKDSPIPLKKNKMNEAKGSGERIAERIRILIYVTSAVLGITLLLLMFGKSLLGFATDSEKRYFPPYLLDFFVDERYKMFREDAIKAMIYVAIVAGVLFLNLKQKIGKNVALIVIGIVSFFDLWSVNKRYLNDDNFIDKIFADNPFQTETSDLLIEKVDDNPELQSLLANANVNKTLETIAEKDQTHYRIYNQISFGETNTSYFKSSIGGYHAVKLRRYDDLLNEYLYKQDSVKTPRILNMLNTKYMIFGDAEHPETVPNPFANGNAWFVSDLKFVKTPNEEIKSIGEIDTKKTAVVSESDKAYFSGNKLVAKDSTARISLTKYQPNEIELKTQSKTSQLAVISEIYYPYGWKMFVDGEEVPYIKANYLLRAVHVPAGKHTIKMLFKPDVIEKGKWFSLSAFILFLLISAAGIFMSFKNSKPQ